MKYIADVSHKSIRQLIQDTATGLQDDIHYSYGKTSDFNQEQKNKFLMVNTSPLFSSASYRDNNVTNYMVLWTVRMVFYKFDVAGSSGEEYALILDETDTLVDKFINSLNFYSRKSDEIIIQSVTKEANVKFLDDICTGHLITFQMLVNDDFDYCREC